MQTDIATEVTADQPARPEWTRVAKEMEDWRHAKDEVLKVARTLIYGARQSAGDEFLVKAGVLEELRATLAAEDRAMMIVGEKILAETAR